MTSKEDKTTIYKAHLILREYVKKRKLRELARACDINYTLLWQVTAAYRYPTFNFMEKLKDYIDPGDWFIEVKE